ncbi:MAG: phosphate acyltransferase PlsX [Puniceicoccales bacterium]|jgi:glycerol-3-phosphate acyltransferase PlsX|nr:phosphate acyltransferase PlsX [Puniceicoccales bacterium]
MNTSAGSKSYRIAVDCMGGDKGPAEVVFAAAMALEDIGPEDTLILIGQEEILTPLLQKAHIVDNPRIKIHHASEIIAMDDKPMQAIKSKKDASMIRALEMVKAGEADAMVSTGNTKVLVGAGTLKLRPMPGADRPALAAIMPNHRGHFILMDVGANPESTPEHLVHNAVLGSLYAQAALGMEKPRVGLLTVGTEEGKGGERINHTHAMLKKLGDQINYVGPVEGFDMFEGEIDVVITDGFTGNVLLKSLEGLFYMLQGLIKEKSGFNLLYALGFLLLMPVLSKLKHHLKPERNGGAPLLGLSALVMKAHGSGNRNAIRSAIRLGREALSHNMTSRMQDALIIAKEKLEESDLIVQ